MNVSRNLLMFLLGSRRPDVYGKRAETKVEVSVIKRIQIEGGGDV